MKLGTKGDVQMAFTVMCLRKVTPRAAIITAMTLDTCKRLQLTADTAGRHLDGADASDVDHLWSMLKKTAFAWWQEDESTRPVRTMTKASRRRRHFITGGASSHASEFHASVLDAARQLVIAPPGLRSPRSDNVHCDRGCGTPTARAGWGCS
jgi:hypothetical protein